MRRSIIFLGTGAWISASEFLRNELLFKGLWIDKYTSLGLSFPSSMVNNAIWGLWSFLLAALILFLSRRLKFLETVLVAWVAAFVLMWLTIFNLNVLPLALLIPAVPLSLIEVLVASLICHKAGSQQ